MSYDMFAEQYNQSLKRGKQHKLQQLIAEQLQLDAELTGAAICELGCGQGELADHLSTLGAKVTAVDSSEKQLDYAKSRTGKVDWVHGDAMTLPDIFKKESFDIVISSLMLMDIPDHNALFRESYRILKPNGIMIWIVMHPCFQSPFSSPLEDGSRNVSNYTPQFWKSKGTNTLRSVLGAYHRPVAQYINDFINAGFVLHRLLEPDFGKNLPNHFGAVGKKK